MDHCILPHSLSILYTYINTIYTGGIDKHACLDILACGSHHSLLCHLIMLYLTSHEGQVRHYHIKVDEDKKYYISEKHRFMTIGDLIEYHKHNGGG